MTAKIHWKLEFSRRILQTNIATYVEMTINKSQSVRSQLFIKDRPFLPDDYLNLIYLNNCMEHVNMKQDNHLIPILFFKNDENELNTEDIDVAASSNEKFVSIRETLVALIDNVPFTTDGIEVNEKGWL